MLDATELSAAVELSEFSVVESDVSDAGVVLSEVGSTLVVVVSGSVVVSERFEVVSAAADEAVLATAPVVSSDDAAEVPDSVELKETKSDDETDELSRELELESEVLESSVGVDSFLESDFRSLSVESSSPLASNETEDDSVSEVSDVDPEPSTVESVVMSESVISVSNPVESLIIISSVRGDDSVDGLEEKSTPVVSSESSVMILTTSSPVASKVSSVVAFSS